MQLFRDPSELNRVSPDFLGKVLDLLGVMFDFIIIDAGAQVNNLVIKALERSAVAFIMTIPDLLALNSTRLLVDKLQLLHFPKEMLKIILNSFEPRGPLTIEVVTQKLQRQILTTVLRNDVLVRDSVIAAVPFVLSQPRADLTRNYDEFAKNLLERRILNALMTVRKPVGAAVGGEGDAANAFMAEAKKEVESWMAGRTKRRSERGEATPAQPSSS